MIKTIFKTTRKESFTTRMIRFGFNFFPAYKRTGGKICFISADWMEVHVKLGLTWKTKNYVGSVFGGSIYGALDPLFMIQLIKILGKEYVVWDKSANIKFIKPIYKNVYAQFLITETILEEIISKVKADKKYDVVLTVNFQDENGVIYAEVSKTMYVANKAFYEAKKAQKK